MSKSAESVSAIEPSSSNPQFRRGTGHLPRKATALRYRRIDFARADAAWRSISSTKAIEIVGSKRIQAAMSGPIDSGRSVSTKSATTYRRVWDHLKLATDRPGTWVRHDFPARGLGGSSEWVDFYSVPASLILHSDDPEAFSEAVRGRDIYVLNRGVEAPRVSLLSSSQERHNQWYIAFGDLIPQTPLKDVVVFVEFIEYAGFFSRDLPYYIRVERKGRESEKKSWDYVEVAPPSTVVLLEREGGDTPWGSTRRRRATTSCVSAETKGCCFSLARRALTVNEIMEATGLSRQKVYRMIEAGEATKVGEAKTGGRPTGLYWCRCCPEVREVHR